jgi:hypothetical protein
MMERHLQRVERWLKRCVAACKCGSWSDALAEAECLEAETKGLREKLWSAAEEEALGVEKHGAAHCVFAVLKVATLAMAMVLTAIIPISLDPEARAPIAFPSAESVALLSSTESDIINALRESLSSGNSGRVVLSVEIPEKIPVPASERGAAMASEKSIPSPRRDVEITFQPAVPAEEAAEAERRPSVDDVLSLIQVGQRALRASEPGVTVVPR